VTVYLDTSVVLRKLLRQKNQIHGWGSWERMYASELMWLESMRVFDRLRIEQVMDDIELSRAVKQLNHIRSAIFEIPLQPAITERAAQSFSTIVRTLDALHLATALKLRETREKKLLFLTHDKQLGLAAEILGFKVEGLR
jgi:predicted nucleic acid-binding protein